MFYNLEILRYSKKSLKTFMMTSHMTSSGKNNRVLECDVSDQHAKFHPPTSQNVFELLRDNQNKWYEKLHDDVTNDVIWLKNNGVLVLRNSNSHVKFQPNPSRISRVMALIL